MLVITYDVGVNIMLGAQNAVLRSLFGNQHRYIGVAISREFSAVIDGGIAVGTIEAIEFLPIPGM
ncbi:hypothetical protein [Gryllotalpicola koreensis]|uniref:Uncharacterized protein n=1 Tax=Gryllotalpicola koreensis TaxID=993086 RepID=A0ABP7ZQL7_9MICO